MLSRSRFARIAALPVLGLLLAFSPALNFFDCNEKSKILIFEADTDADTPGSYCGPNNTPCAYYFWMWDESSHCNDQGEEWTGPDKHCLTATGTKEKEWIDCDGCVTAEGFQVVNQYTTVIYWEVCES